MIWDLWVCGLVCSGKRSTQVEGHADDDTNVNGDDNVGVHDDDDDGGAIASTDGRHPGDLE